MRYPTFIKKNDCIGICAPSAGVGKKLDSFDCSINNLKKQGYKIKETKHVRVNSLRGGSAKQRAQEFEQLINDQKVKMIMCAAGGDFLVEMLPYLHENVLTKCNKWVMGASDPTSILYMLTTKYDLATLYGLNAGSYDMPLSTSYISNNLKMLKGNLVTQNSFAKYQTTENFLSPTVQFSEPVYWESNGKTINIKGRCIGGCIDVLKDLIGTRFDGTLEFINRYQTDGIVWYFDNFAQSSDVFYRTLLQMKDAGWFKNTKLVLIGRVLFPSGDSITYQQACKKALGKIPFIMDCDIGHVSPKMTMINGALISVKAKKGKGSIVFELK